MKAAITISIFVALTFALGTRTAESAETLTPRDILGNMPVNSDFRCTGIALVAEALLEGTMIQDTGCDRPEELGRAIYDVANKKAAIRFRSNLCLENGPSPIHSREALDRLTTEVANLYKQRHEALMATAQGREQIVTGQQAMVKTVRELDAIMDADRDKIHAFCAIGNRSFPDASAKPTYHVVLIAKRADGKKVIYDPNDPGAAIDCRMQETRDGLYVKWTCNYQDTGQVTTQEYQLVDRERFFRVALALQ